jgi:hypothetical protein
MRTAVFLLLVCLATSDLIPEEAAQVQVIEGEVLGQYEGIFIKVNGEHRDNGEQVYVQVNLNVKIQEGNVIVNDHILPFTELQSFVLQAQISEISDGVTGEFEPVEVTVNMFLHEQTESERGNVARAFRLELQIVETDQYDIHMFNVTEVVMELDTQQQEVRRTVTLISEEDSKLHAARHCPVFRCRPIPGCKDYRIDAAGCQTCDCAAMEVRPMTEPCLASCDGVCGDGPYIVLDDPTRDRDGCWVCPCLAIDTFEPPTIGCDFGRRVMHKFQELPYPLRLVIVVLLTVIAFILTVTCCATVCCRPGQKAKAANKTNNLKAFGFGKLQIYVPDHEKKQPLIDNLDVVSADIA